MNAKRYFTVMAVLLISTLRCGVDDPEIAGSGSQTSNNGKCIGMIYTMENAFASGATVRLIPSGYNPSVLSSGKVDSAVTDNEGRYTFTVTKTDFYNIIAERGNQASFMDSVPLLSDMENHIENDTLRGTGWLAGKVEVKPGDDPLQAIILIPGTGKYTSPADSLGTFPPLSLPTGSYTIRVFTSETGYGIFDTTVTITSDNTSLIIARIPTSYAPAINNFEVVFDSTLRTATLTWDPVDPSLIRSITIHRLIDGVEDTIIIVGKNFSSYVDSIPKFVNTFIYKAAAVGANYKEGYMSVSEPMQVFKTSFKVTKTPLPNLKFSYIEWIGVNTDENLYLGNNQSDITMISDDGTVLKSIGVGAILNAGNNIGGDTVLLGTTLNSIKSDEHSNIYVYISSEWGDGRISGAVPIPEDVLIPEEEVILPFVMHSVHKLDKNLTVISSLTFPDSSICCKEIYPPRPDDVIVGDDGTIYLNSNCTDSAGSTIYVYDAEFHYQNTFYVSHTISIKQCYRDSIIATSPTDSPLQRIMIFDKSFNLLSLNQLNINCMVLPLSGSHFLAVTDTVDYGSYIGYDYSSVPAAQLIDFDSKGKKIGNQIFPPDIEFQIKSSGLFYGVSLFYGPVLYRISVIP
jgi:hypothetical protein